MHSRCLIYKATYMITDTNHDIANASNSLSYITGISSERASLFISEILNDLNDWTAPIANSAEKPNDHVRVLAILQANRFSRNKGKFGDNALKIINAAIATKKPIPISVVCGPLKNRRLNTSQAPDWAEVFLYAQLARIAKAVREVYSPGINVELILDDARCQYANDVPNSIFEEYAQNTGKLLSALNLSPAQIYTSSQKPIYNRLDVYSHIPEAEVLVSDFLKSSTVQDSWNTITRNSCENNTEGCDSEAAAIRYLVAQKAEILAGFWQNSDRILLRYGRSPDEVQRLWTIRKGSTSLPWQGIGGILVLPDGELRPCIWQPYRECGLKLLIETKISFFSELLPTTIPILHQADCPNPQVECGNCQNTR